MASQGHNPQKGKCFSSGIFQGSQGHISSCENELLQNQTTSCIWFLLQADISPYISLSCCKAARERPPPQRAPTIMSQINNFKKKKTYFTQCHVFCYGKTKWVKTGSIMDYVQYLCITTQMKIQDISRPKNNSSLSLLFPVNNPLNQPSPGNHIPIPLFA